MEIASHSENHELFQNQAQNRQFDRIQDSRLAIEEISKSRVLGFRPPSENYDSDSVSAAVGNRLAYFYGDRRFLRYSPAWVAQGRMLFYPRVLNDDFSLHKKRELSNPEEFLHTVMRDYGVAHSVGGAYLFGMHTHIFGLPGYEIVVRKIVEKLSAQNDSWSTHFSALTNWVSGRAHLESRIEGESGNQVLFVHNTGDAAIGGVVVEVDTGRKALPISVGQLGPGESRRIPIPSHP
jgi:peptidoglycan/xylan/chitin deacetylase (PgdA/CDA1 family)